MNLEIQEKIKIIFQEQKRLADEAWDIDVRGSEQNKTLVHILSTVTSKLSTEDQERIQQEMTGYGPLNQILQDDQITEVLVNSYEEIYFEKSGTLHKHQDRFYSPQTYESCLDRISQNCHSYLNRDKPFLEAQLGHWRVTILFSELSRGSSLLSIRKQPTDRWTLERLSELGWCTAEQKLMIEKIFAQKNNFLVVGGTGSGKTSLLQSMLEKFSKLERAVIIEDTQELHLPNQTCCSLLTRQDPSGTVRDIPMDDLLKRALRLRPDRLVIGEIRGPEAKSLLMALATGHDGSFGSMHARTAQEALLRLEMLIQMGAPQWNLKSIRHLIAMTLKNIFVVEKVNGKRRLQGIYEISSLEENGIILQRLDD
ncbi:MAG: hypothetical protein A2622_08685 [Bdellovibrionales bacterium RIFCSPHIGHO2_01_FULL_40_29]|nr:MAG: hypothetical protein A2622_08685 [Bdellovibrionales bacterium RIFCSPHIGHO2_01_FULL_40_29]OFZ32816.1 MAG: hypothetical protein A3D17_08895 [Bdellovibrionales bacterium RIFCSPHIGHO2_02_FULL_40_15]